MTTVSSTGCHGGFRPPWLSLFLAGIIVGGFVLFGAAPRTLLFDRAAIGGGEVWRLLTGHFVHVDASHLAWNFGAFALICTALESFLITSRRAIAAASLAGTLVIDMTLWWGVPELERYAGLSGILNTLFILLIYEIWRRIRQIWVPIAGGWPLEK